MSALLDALIEQRRQQALDYQAYLRQIIELSRRVSQPERETEYPATINTGALRALYDNLEGRLPPVVQELATGYGNTRPLSARERAALALDRAIRAVKKADWRGNRFKEREVRNAIKEQLQADDAAVERIFEIVKAQREY